MRDNAKLDNTSKRRDYDSVFGDDEYAARKEKVRHQKKTYWDKLATPSPRYMQKQTDEPPKKKTKVCISHKFCPPRIDQLANPTTPRMEGVLTDFHNTLEPKRIVRIVKLIHTNQQPKPIRHTVKRRRKHQSKRLKKHTKEKLEKEWLDRQTDVSAQLIMDFLGTRVAYTPNYKQVILSLGLMKALRPRMHHRQLREHLLKFCEQVAIISDREWEPYQHFEDIESESEEDLIPEEDKKHIFYRIESTISLSEDSEMAEDYETPIEMNEEDFDFVGNVNVAGGKYPGPDTIYEDTEEEDGKDNAAEDGYMIEEDEGIEELGEEEDIDAMKAAAKELNDKEVEEKEKEKESKGGYEEEAEKLEDASPEEDKESPEESAEVSDENKVAAEDELEAEEEEGTTKGEDETIKEEEDTIKEEKEDTIKEGDETIEEKDETIKEEEEEEGEGESSVAEGKQEEEEGVEGDVTVEEETDVEAAENEEEAVKEEVEEDEETKIEKESLIADSKEETIKEEDEEEEEKIESEAGDEENDDEEISAVGKEELLAGSNKFSIADPSKIMEEEADIWSNMIDEDNEETIELIDAQGNKIIMKVKDLKSEDGTIIIPEGMKVADKIKVQVLIEHPEGTASYVAYRVYSSWLEEFGQNIQTYSTCLRTFRDIISKAQSEKDTTASEHSPAIREVLLNWSSYLAETMLFESTMKAYFKGKAVSRCTKCSDTYNMYNLPTDEEHELPPELRVALEHTAHWKQLLSNAEKHCQLFTSVLESASLGSSYISVDIQDMSSLMSTDESAYFVEMVDDDD